MTMSGLSVLLDGINTHPELSRRYVLLPKRTNMLCVDTLEF